MINSKNQIWSNEHGPKGGDELNIIAAGLNYGWPAVSYGTDYTGALVSPFTEAENMVSPIAHWTPSIATGGMAYYEAEAFASWQDNILLANLAERSLRRLVIEDNKVVHQEVLLQERNERLRDVRVGPDGFVYLLTDAMNGKLLRLKPE